MDQRDQGGRDHQPGPRRLRLPDPDRAQGARPDAAPLRPEPRRPVRAPPARGRPDQADPQGGVRAGGRDRPPVHPRPGRGRLRCARGVRGDPVGPRLGDRRLPGRRSDRRRADRPAPDLRARLDRDLRLHRRRLGERVEVLAARLDAHVRAARQLRGRARADRARRDPDGGVALARRHRPRAGPRRLVHRAAADRLRHVLHRGDRGDEPRALRPPRSRAGARRGLPHRVLGHALGPLPDGRVHQHAHALGPGRDALPRRLARPGRHRLARPALVPAQARARRVRLHLAARDLPAAPLRPADDARLEGAPAGRDRRTP